MVPVLVALGSFVTTLAGGFAALRFRDYQHLRGHAHHPSRLTLLCTILGVGFMWLVIGLAG